MAVQRHAAAESPAMPFTSGQHWTLASPTCTSFPRTSTQAPSLSASMGHLSEDGVGVGVGVGGDGGGGHAFRCPFFVGLGLPPTIGMGGRVTGGRGTDGMLTGGRGTDGMLTGGSGTDGMLTGGRGTPPVEGGEPDSHEWHSGSAFSHARASGDEESASMASTSSAESLVDSIADERLVRTVCGAGGFVRARRFYRRHGIGALLRAPGNGAVAMQWHAAQQQLTWRASGIASAGPWLVAMAAKSKLSGV
jgi:hypothetical protein